MTSATRLPAWMTAKYRLAHVQSSLDSLARCTEQEHGKLLRGVMRVAPGSRGQLALHFPDVSVLMFAFLAHQFRQACQRASSLALSPALRVTYSLFAVDVDARTLVLQVCASAPGKTGRELLDWVSGMAVCHRVIFEAHPRDEVMTMSDQELLQHQRSTSRSAGSASSLDLSLAQTLAVLNGDTETLECLDPEVQQWVLAIQPALAEPEYASA